MKKKIVLLTIIMALLMSACGTNVTKLDNQSDDSSTEDYNSTEMISSDDSDNSNSASLDNLGNALNLVNGTSDEDSVFNSYHIELLLDTPQPNEDYSAVINETISISADVEGKNVHIFQIDPGETEAKEGYIIGENDTEYKLVDGNWQETNGQIAMAWAMWPLQVVMPYAYATSLYTNKTGTEDIDGRTAIVYELDSSKADPATLAGMQDYGMNMTAKGKVWIDKETGGMLKLLMDYTSDLTTLDGSETIGTGTGHIELKIYEVGKVTVTSPVQ